MTRVEINEMSKSIEYQNKYLVDIPATIDMNKKVDIVMLLHDYGENYKYFLKYNLDLHLNDAQTILVYVNAHNSYYLNTVTNKQYTKYIGEEILENLEKTFKFKIKTKSIMGISMGGYGAMLIGLIYNFDNIITLGGCVCIEKVFDKAEDDRFGNIIYEVKDDIKIDYLLTNYISSKPNIFSYCGKNDPYYDDNKYINSIIKKQKYTAKILSDDGTNEFCSWKKQMPNVFKFLSEVVKNDEN